MPRAAVLILAAIAACAPTPRMDDAGLAGYYRFVELNGQTPPVEFPAGSGAFLKSGILELGDDLRFALQFASRRQDVSDREETGPVGVFVIHGDSLLFAPDDSIGHPPVRFRYDLAGDDLRLWDTAGNTWGYRRVIR